MNTVIKVENISKQYRLGVVGTGTIAHDLNRWWHRVRGNEDPYLKIGETNDRSKKGETDYVWALRNINFDVQQGEILGIIGRNGAGKSTLLKILSRTTAPTVGTVKLKGRVASLLEVGTGFNPELSGRDNIYLNGTILGMTKKEITRKFDEIVDFSGVSRYIDTPVKRYSSGMYVRLAFAVAAHLESEVLIIDEVLAVGDVEFQKKCLGKMGDISKNEGRTVLFVSHNIAAISSLCTKSIVLINGQVQFEGDVEQGIDHYLINDEHKKGYAEIRNNKSSLWKQHRLFSRLQDIETLDTDLKRQTTFKMGDRMVFHLNIEITELRRGIEIGLLFYGSRGTLLGFCNSTAEGFQEFKEGMNKLRVETPLYFTPGDYTVGVWVMQKGQIDDACESAIDFEIIANNFTGNDADFDRFKGYGNFARSSWILQNN